MKICVYGAASDLIDKSYIEKGEELGKLLVKQGHGLVFGGGAHGMMGAAARGVFAEKGHILAIVPEFFKEANAEISFNKCSEYMYTKTVRERKEQLEKKSDAIIITPGGIGTYDEFFEVLTLKQLGRHNKALAIYNINGYFNEMDNMMSKAIEKEFITKDCKELYKVFNEEQVEEMFEYIENYDSKTVDINKVKIR